LLSKEKKIEQFVGVDGQKK